MAGSRSRKISSQCCGLTPSGLRSKLVNRCPAVASYVPMTHTAGRHPDANFRASMAIAGANWVPAMLVRSVLLGAGNGWPTIMGVYCGELGGPTRQREIRTKKTRGTQERRENTRRPSIIVRIREKSY